MDWGIGWSVGDHVGFVVGLEVGIAVGSEGTIVVAVVVEVGLAELGAGDGLDLADIPFRCYQICLFSSDQKLFGPEE